MKTAIATCFLILLTGLSAKSQTFDHPDDAGNSVINTITTTLSLPVVPVNDAAILNLLSENTIDQNIQVSSYKQLIESRINSSGIRSAAQTTLSTQFNHVVFKYKRFKLNGQYS